MSVTRALDDTHSIGGIIGGFAPLDSGLLVPASYLPTDDIADNITGVLGKGKVTRTNVGANITVASTSWQDMDGTNLTLTFDTGARSVLLIISGRISNGGANLTRIGFSVDGTPVLTEAANSTGVVAIPCVAGASAPLMAWYVTDTLTAASHTFKPRWNCSAGTTTGFTTASTDFITFTATELMA